MKDCKLIVSDLDGTILSRDMTLSPKNLSAIESFRELGILFMASTGRTLSEVPKCVRENPNIRYIAYSNGAAVYDKEAGKNIITNSVSAEDAKKMLDILSEYDVLWTLHSDGKTYYDKNRATEENFKYYNVNDYYRDVILEGGVPTDDVGAFVKGSSGVEGFFVFFHSNEERSELGERLESEVPGVSVTSTIEYEFEICAANAGKGTALLAFSEMMGISGENTIVLGDSDNDVSMFPYAALAICVSNGSDSAKELADEIGPSCEEDLLDYVLKKHIEKRENPPKKERKSKIAATLASILILLAVILSTHLFGREPAVKIGYQAVRKANSWSATYSMIDGETKHKITAKSGKLLISVKTEEGNISIEILDSDGNTLFDKENVGTEAFELDVPEKVTVIIEAEKHKGSFVIGSLDE